ncbi:hypothetical protein Ddc_12203 [Ditylenchus destructor]|nr:hypothetical protein Ddc_12203 [Ditylenchus destructor]
MRASILLLTLLTFFHVGLIHALLRKKSVEILSRQTVNGLKRSPSPSPIRNALRSGENITGQIARPKSPGVNAGRKPNAAELPRGRSQVPRGNPLLGASNVQGPVTSKIASQLPNGAFRKAAGGARGFATAADAMHLDPFDVLVKQIDQFFVRVTPQQAFTLRDQLKNGAQRFIHELKTAYFRRVQQFVETWQRVKMSGKVKVSPVWQGIKTKGSFGYNQLPKDPAWTPTLSWQKGKMGMNDLVHMVRYMSEGFSGVLNRAGERLKVSKYKKELGLALMVISYAHFGDEWRGVFWKGWKKGQEQEIGDYKDDPKWQPKIDAQTAKIEANIKKAAEAKKVPIVDIHTRPEDMPDHVKSAGDNNLKAVKTDDAQKEKIPDKVFEEEKDSMAKQGIDLANNTGQDVGPDIVMSAGDDFLKAAKKVDVKLTTSVKATSGASLKEWLAKKVAVPVFGWTFWQNPLLEGTIDKIMNYEIPTSAVPEWLITPDDELAEQRQEFHDNFVHMTGEEPPAAEYSIPNKKDHIKLGMACKNNPNSDNFSQLFFVNTYKQMALFKHYLVHAIKETAAEKLYDVKESNKGKPVQWTAFGRFVAFGRQGRTLPHYRNNQQILQGATQKVVKSTSPNRNQWGPLLDKAGVTPAKPAKLQAPTFSLDRGSAEKKRRRKRANTKKTGTRQGTATEAAARETEEDVRKRLEKEAIKEVKGDLRAMAEGKGEDGEEGAKFYQLLKLISLYILEGMHEQEKTAEVLLQNPLLTPDDIKYAQEMAQAYEAVSGDVNELSESMTLEQVKFNPDFRKICTKKQVTDHNKLLEKARKELKEDPVAGSPKLGTVDLPVIGCLREENINDDLYDVVPNDEPEALMEEKMNELAKVLNDDRMTIPFVEEAHETDGVLKALAKSLIASKEALKQIKPEDSEEKKVKATETFISALVKYSEKIGDKAPPMQKVVRAKPTRPAAAKRPAGKTQQEAPAKNSAPKRGAKKTGGGE